jgi:hypothetical protein
MNHTVALATEASGEVAVGCDALGLSGGGGTMLHNAHSTTTMFFHACLA